MRYAEGDNRGVPEVALLGKLAIAVLLAISVARGFAGAPARARHPAAARTLLFVAGALYAGAGATLVADDVLVSAVLAVLGVEASCVSAWLARASGEGGDDDGGGGGPGPDDGDRPVPRGPVIDWDAFDRARSGWERGRTPAR
jgi:hypothetical protein